MLKRLARFIPAGSMVLAATTLGSYVMGLLRDHLLAQTFGASRVLDVYNAAFLLPDFIFNFLVASGIAAAFVPLFTQLLARQRSQAYIYANTIILTASGVMSIVAVLLIVGAPIASTLVAPGFSAPDQHLVAQLLRILALSPILFAASNALGAMLIAKSRFFWYGLSPIVYNFGIIAGIYFLAPRHGIMGVALGTLAGAGLHLGTRLIDALISGWRPSWILAWRQPEFLTTLRLMLPKMFGHPIELATFWAFTALASALAPGSIAIMNFARNFQSVPVSIIGITIATTSFPLLAATRSRRSRQQFGQVLRRSSWLIFLAALAAAALMWLIRQPLIALLLGGREFSTDDIRRTAVVLGIFCLSIPTEALTHLLARAFYATQNTLTPVLISLASFIFALLGAWWLLPSLEILALPLAFFIGSLLKLVLLWWRLPTQLEGAFSQQ